MAKCKTCGGAIFNEVELSEYHDDLLGMPVVVMDAVVQHTCAKCGKVRGVLIPNFEGLVAAMAMVRISMPAKLCGAELRFMRKALVWKAKDMADKLGVVPETLSRWEHGKDPINATSERLLRLMVGSLLREKAPKIPFNADQIVGMKIIAARTAGPREPLYLYAVKESAIASIGNASAQLANDDLQWAEAKAA